MNLPKLTVVHIVSQHPYHVYNQVLNPNHHLIYNHLNLMHSLDTLNVINESVLNWKHFHTSIKLDKHTVDYHLKNDFKRENNLNF
ncbi:unnamed protein product [Schistosoma curassoni]|uniref:Uncharacterized protein n=1 Tax=Schistosoma curassoni TaxID=6186 RepID=A0A3P7Y1B5_9TREM|nr:unnamed protein product [Schistosoma curassoni]